MSRKQINLIKVYLENSPANQLKKFMKILTVPQSHKIIPPPISDETYVNNYIKSMGFVPSINHQQNFGIDQLRQITGDLKSLHSCSSQPQSQSLQLLHGIRDFAAFADDSLIPYQELQQLITIAKPETINDVRVRLNYLFKLLLNKRNKLPPNSLQLETNLQLSQTILNAFERSVGYAESNQEWAKLQAMEKLYKAREFKQKGQNGKAIESFQQVFKDQAAESKTRMQALKVLCSEGQQLGDVNMLLPLMNLSQEKGEKQFERFISQSIKKIKQSENQKFD